MIRKIYKNVPGVFRYRLEPLASRFRRFRAMRSFKVEPAGDFPRIIQIETNSYCNGACIFCPYQNVSHGSENKLMPEGLFRKIMDECALHRVDEIFLCLMNEPLSDKRIIEFINYAKGRNPSSKIRIITNAQLLSRGMAEGLIGSRLDGISFSVHGWTSGTYKKIMGMELDKAIENIERFIKLNADGRLAIGMVCVKTRDFTKSDYYAAYSFSKKYDLDFALSDMFNMADNLPADQRVRLGLKNSYKENIRGCIENWPLNSMHIMYDGTVVACCVDWKKEIVLGDAAGQTLRSIWQDDKYRDFREKVYKGKPSGGHFICKRCSTAV